MNMVYLPLPLARFPSRWAHSIEHMKMCEAFAHHGVSVRMLYHAPVLGGDRHGFLENVSDFYALREQFSVVMLPGLQAQHRYLRAIKADTISRIATAVPYVLRAWLRGWLRGGDIVYSRNRSIGVALVGLLRCIPPASRPKVIYEVHEPEDQSFALLAPGLAGVVTISQALKDHLCATFHIPPGRVIVERCGVDAGYFAASMLPQGEARRQLGLPGNGARIVAYCGRIDASRGVDVLIRAAHRFRDRGWLCLIVGGSPEDAWRLPAVDGIPSSVVFAGRVPPAQVPAWLSAADVLVAPHANRGQYDRGSSPLKLFEYMAAQRPIVTTRVPAVQEILTDREHAILVEPDSPEDLIRGVSWVVDHPREAEALAERAYALGRRHAWTERARRILEFIERIPPASARAPVVEVR
jgi:glycosyltransferase involved in cell wall biosynthesis